MRFPMALAGGVLVATAFTGCGSADAGSTSAPKNKYFDESYCAALTQANDKYFSDDDNVLADTDAAFARIHDLAEVAPAEVKASWKVVDDAIAKVVTALAEVDMTFTELTDSFDGRTPDSATMAKIEKLGPVMQDMTGADYSEAQEKVAAHAKKSCGIDDFGSLGGVEDASD